MSMLRGTRRALLGGPRLRPFDFDLALAAFTAAMDKRLAPGPFYTAPIIQGDLDGSGVPDVLSFPRGDLLANQTQVFYANFDPYQGSIVFWITPEWDGDDGLVHQFVDTGTTTDLLFYKDGGSSALTLYVGGQFFSAMDVSGWVAGTTYFIVVRWDTKNTIDGTNYASVSANNVHTYGVTTAPAVIAPNATVYVGNGSGTGFSADSIIEGLTIYRRPITDGDGFGTNIGVLDEIEDIYAAGAGVDPCLVVGNGGAWDAVACMPTNSTDEELTSGDGEMWSMPHAASIPDVTFMSDGGLPGTPFAVEYDEATTLITVLDNATIQDLADNAFTVGIWVRADGWGENNTGYLATKRGSPAALEGWKLNIQSSGSWGLVATVYCATTHAESYSGIDDFIPDGKWHYVTMFFDDGGDRKIYLAVDGEWVATYGGQTTGVGAIVSDVGNNLVLGNREDAVFTTDGGVAWAAIWSDDHHVAGTDFIPPRTPPGPGGNLVESWHMDEGTGVTVAAQVTSPANDGTITNPATPPWTSIWEVELTPVVPRSILYDGVDTSTVVADAAAIQDLHAGEFTFEAWISPDDWGEGDAGIVFNKRGGGGGWELRVGSTNGLVVIVDCATTNAVARSGLDEFSVDGISHLVTAQFDGTALPAGNPVVYLWVDGIPIASYETQTAGVGAASTDVGDDLYLGNNLAGSRTFDGRLGGWARLSDVLRYTPGEAFVPDAFDSPPALPDANSVWQTDYSDGAGTTLTDDAAGGNDGTITFGAGKWLVTPDMALQEPGARVFSNGYVIGSDGANDGITDIETVVAETDYVIRPFLSYGQSGRAWPEIYLYDNIGAAQIGATFSLPRMTDVHTGGNGSATLVNANGSFTQQLVGWTLYNITDGSSTTITAVSGDKTTITGVLAGGTDDDWDTNDVYIIRPPSNAPYARYPIATEAIFVFRTPVACVSMDIKVRNAAGEGVMQVHQCEVYESEADSGDMEGVFAGVPPIPPNWLNSGLDAGDTQAEAVTIHAGVQSMQWNPGAINDEIIYQIQNVAPGTYVSMGCWTYGDGSVGLRYEGNTHYVPQYLPGAADVDTNPANVWSFNGIVMRAGAGINRMRFGAITGAIADRFLDDLFSIRLDPITITVTPANQANSLEGTGIRVVGHSTLTQPAPVALLTPTSGDIRFDWTPRHSDTLAVSFGHISAWLLRIDGGANNYIDLVWNAADNLRIQFNANGAGIQIGNWATGGGAIVPSTIYPIRILYSSAWMRLYVDGIIRATIIAPTGFAWTDPMVAYWGSDDVGDFQADSVFAAPG